jgi:hypothetical protein
MHGKKNIIIPYSETTTGTIGSLVYNPTNSLGSPTTTTTTTTSRVVHFPRTKNTTSNLYSLGKGRSSSSNIVNNTANIATTYQNIPRIPQALALHMLKTTLVRLKAVKTSPLCIFVTKAKSPNMHRKSLTFSFYMSTLFFCPSTLCFCVMQHHEDTLRMIKERDKIRLRLAIQDLNAAQKQRRQQEQEKQLRKQKQQVKA